MSYQAYEFLVAPTPSTYQTGRGILFSERHLKELEQRRIRSQISQVLLSIQNYPAFHSHSDHLEFLFREYSLAQTPERRASVKAQVDHYARILAEHQTYSSAKGAPVPRVSTPPPSPTSLSAPEQCVAHSEPAFAAPETIYETPMRPTTIPAEPPAPPRLKKTGTLPLSAPPTPKLLAMNAVMRSKSGNLSPEDFERGMEYMIYLLEMAGAPAAKLAAYVELYDYFMDQPIIMMKSPEIRRAALSNIQATRAEMAPTNETLASLEQRFTTFLESLRVHPYYVA
jgi:hypothetical protein